MTRGYFCTYTYMCMLHTFTCYCMYVILLLVLRTFIFSPDGLGYGKYFVLGFAFSNKRLPRKGLTHRQGWYVRVFLFLFPARVPSRMQYTAILGRTVHRAAAGTGGSSCPCVPGCLLLCFLLQSSRILCSAVPLSSTYMHAY